MGRLKITDFLVYRYRYIASYVAIGFILLALLFMSGVLVPGGISSVEMDAATKSGNLTTGAIMGTQLDNVISLPYRALQSFSLHLFGVSAISIKLPSLLLAAGAIVLLYGILQLWFRRNVAIIGTIITMTSSQFLLQSQSGTYGIIYMFWGALLLFVASKMATTKTYRPLWLILTAITAGLSLYTPYMLYIIVPLAFAALIHPHARFLVFRQPLWAILSAFAVFILCLLPLSFAAVNQPMVILHTLAGNALGEGAVDVQGNISELTQYFDFYNNQGGRILQPAYGLGLLLLAVVGVFRLLSAKYTAKSYIMTVWTVLTIPILFVNPNVAAVAILPIAILSAFAIDLLIRRWYTMFPRNPYARVAGLLPLGILVLVLSVSSMDRYIYGYIYDPAAVSAYSKDLALLDNEINRTDADITLYVPKPDQDFYSMYAHLNTLDTRLSVSSDTPSLSPSRTTIVSGSLEDTNLALATPSRIVVSQTTDDGNRFYVYEK